MTHAQSLKAVFGQLCRLAPLDLEYSVHTSGRALEREYFGLLSEYLLTGPLPLWDAGDACEFQPTENRVSLHPSFSTLQRYVTH